MGNKPKSTQKEKPNKIQGRDLFQTPNYGTELLIPFIPKHIKHIWECACGKGKMGIAFALHGCYNILATDLATGTNFLDADFPFRELRREHTAIITNPPYSLKRKFYERCKYHGVPFALLIPADYCGWIINALRFDGAEKIIPTRRIDFITPGGRMGKNSASQFHSLWLTWGFGLGKTETFVDLTLDMKKNI